MSCAYLNLPRNVQDMLGPYMGFSEEANLRNTTAGQPCRYVVSLGRPYETNYALVMMKTSAVQRLVTKALPYAL